MAEGLQRIEFEIPPPFPRNTEEIDDRLTRARCRVGSLFTTLFMVMILIASTKLNAISVYSNAYVEDDFFQCGWKDGDSNILLRAGITWYKCNIVAIISHMFAFLGLLSINLAYTIYKSQHLSRRGYYFLLLFLCVIPFISLMYGAIQWFYINSHFEHGCWRDTYSIPPMHREDDDGQLFVNKTIGISILLNGVVIIVAMTNFGAHLHLLSATKPIIDCSCKKDKNKNDRNNRNKKRKEVENEGQEQLIIVKDQEGIPEEIGSEREDSNVAPLFIQLPQQLPEGLVVEC